MRTKAMVAGADLIVLLLFMALLFSGPRKPAQDITVRHIKSFRSGDWVTATFEIGNNTARSYFINPVSVEVRNGQVWEKCFDWGSQSFPIDEFGPHGSKSRTFFMTNLPTCSALRLRLTTSETLTGLKARLAYFEWSVVKHKNLLVPLDLFHKNFGFSRTIEIVSEEFVEPEPK